MMQQSDEDDRKN